jgi:preprotein translocase subunit SecG
MSYFLMVLLFLTAVFLVVLVLIQRGKGGGLAGALGGMGGQSAFGTKAGDLFTRITIGVAAFWILLCMFCLWYFRAPTSRFGDGTVEPPASSAPANPADGEAPSGK